MKAARCNAIACFVAVALLAACARSVCAQSPPAGSEADPLPAWRDGAAKQAILRFVEKTTQAGSPDFVAPAERIAVFDNDGTLWAEQPMYFQALFMLDQVKSLAPRHPEWRTQEPFASLLAGDVKAALAGGEAAIGRLIMATHAGMTSDEFARAVGDWITMSTRTQNSPPVRS